MPRKTSPALSPCSKAISLAQHFIPSSHLTPVSTVSLSTWSAKRKAWHQSNKNKNKNKSTDLEKRATLHGNNNNNKKKG